MGASGMLTLRSERPVKVGRLTVFRRRRVSSEYLSFSSVVLNATVQGKPNMDHGPWVQFTLRNPAVHWIKIVHWAKICSFCAELCQGVCKQQLRCFVAFLRDGSMLPSSVLEPTVLYLRGSTDGAHGMLTLRSERAAKVGHLTFFRR